MEKEKTCRNCIYDKIYDCNDRCNDGEYIDWSDDIRDLIGKKVVRGKDWKWWDQDGGGEGTVVSQGEVLDGRVYVAWDNNNMAGITICYRMGYDGRWDLYVIGKTKEKPLTFEEDVAMASEMLTSRRKGLSRGWELTK
jgi:hypothetical protein